MLMGTFAWTRRRPVISGLTRLDFSRAGNPVQFQQQVLGDLIFEGEPLDGSPG